MSEPELFADELNGPQLEAVHTLSGPLLILAGAGSGKTRVLTYRIANLIIQGMATPSEILAVTFTNKAARNMETRSLDLLARFQIPVWDRLWISTFHSTCVRILRSHIHHLGFQPFFAIFDQSDQLSVLNKVVESLNLNPKIHAPKSFQAFINDAKMKGLTPEHIGRGHLSFREDTALDVYTRYEEEMEKNNALDFGDLLLKVDLLFSAYPQVLEEYRERFKFIHVDEYQDTNPIQYKIVQKLAASHQNLCVVGDEDQSIYSWRGADISNILNFESDFPAAKVIKLEENYRSSQTIVKAASHVIQNNSQRKEKSLFTSNEAGAKIIIREENNEYDEARFVARRIQELRRETNAHYRDFAVFYRTNAQSRVIEEQLRSNTTPYKIVGGVKFYERLEIKDLMSYLRLMVNPKDDVALARIINVPTRGIGKTTLEKLEAYAMKDKIAVLEAIPRTLHSDLFNSSTQKKLNAFMMMMSELRKEADRLTKPSEIYHRILETTGYVEHLKSQDTQEAEARIDNLEELDNAIVQFEKERGSEATLQAFLEEIALVSDVDSMVDQEDSVTMMTLHISKGLEFPYVFIVGMEEGLFPSGRSFESQDPTAMEEERRLCYVGMTRAEKQLHLSHARSRKVWGVDQHNVPSRFLAEIPDEYIEKKSGVERPAFLNRFRERFGNTGGGANETATSGAYGARANPSWGSTNLDTPRSDSRNTPRTQSKASASWKSDEYSQNFQDDLPDDSSTSGLAKGVRVRHPTFGVGTVYQLEGEGEQSTVSILFANQVLKKFVVKYARLERV